MNQDKESMKKKKRMFGLVITLLFLLIHVYG
jgi:hypothetical protein